MKFTLALMLLFPFSGFCADSIKLSADSIISYVDDHQKEFPKAEVEDNRTSTEAYNGYGCELIKKGTVLFCFRRDIDVSSRYKMTLPLDKDTSVKISNDEEFLEITGPLATALKKVGAKSETKE